MPFQEGIFSQRALFSTDSDFVVYGDIMRYWQTTNFHVTVTLVRLLVTCPQPPVLGALASCFVIGMQVKAECSAFMKY